MPDVPYDHHTAALDDFAAGVKQDMSVLDRTRLRVSLSISESMIRQANAMELANDIAALSAPGLLDDAQREALRARVLDTLAIDTEDAAGASS